MTDQEYDAWVETHTWDPQRDSRRLTCSEDLGAAAWLEDKLSQGSFNVDMTAPGGYEAYARVFRPFQAKPVQNESGAWTQTYESWSEVARRNGRIAHPLMEESKIDVDSSGRPARRGSIKSRLTDDQTKRLISILEKHTTSQKSWFLLWDGFGDLNRRAFRDDVPKVQHPIRDYFLLEGPLAGFADFPEDPDYWWPEDQAWCYCTDTDFDWAYVAGSTPCVAEVLSDSILEALPTRPEDPAAEGMDTINS
jgi:hypothetical protein